MISYVFTHPVDAQLHEQSDYDHLKSNISVLSPFGSPPPPEHEDRIRPALCVKNAPTKTSQVH